MKNNMKSDTIGFLEALLFAAAKPKQFEGETVYDFSPKFTNAVEKFIDAFREHLEHTGFPVSKLDAMERSFGANVYYSLSGHGCGFFDDSDEEIAALHDVLKAWAGAYRFEGLDGMLDLDGEGKIDLAFIPEALEEYRAKIFGVPVSDIPPGPAPQPPEKAGEVKPLSHTTGPWKLDYDNPRKEWKVGKWTMRNKPKGPIIAVSGAYSDTRLAAEEHLANARLITAAPELLEALDALVKTHTEGACFKAIVNARAAIRKAKGGN